MLQWSLTLGILLSSLMQSFPSNLCWSPPWFCLLPRRWESLLRWATIHRHSAGRSARRHGVNFGLQLVAILSPWQTCRTAVCSGSVDSYVHLRPTCPTASRAVSRTVASVPLCLSSPTWLLSLPRSGFRCLHIVSLHSGSLLRHLRFCSALLPRRRDALLQWRWCTNLGALQPRPSKLPRVATSRTAPWLLSLGMMLALPATRHRTVMPVSSIRQMPPRLSPLCSTSSLSACHSSLQRGLESRSFWEARETCVWMPYSIFSRRSECAPMASSDLRMAPGIGWQSSIPSMPTSPPTPQRGTPCATHRPPHGSSRGLSPGRTRTAWSIKRCRRISREFGGMRPPTSGRCATSGPSPRRRSSHPSSASSSSSCPLRPARRFPSSTASQAAFLGYQSFLFSRISGRTASARNTGIAAHGSRLFTSRPTSTPPLTTRPLHRTRTRKANSGPKAPPSCSPLASCHSSQNCQGFLEGTSSNRVQRFSFFRTLFRFDFLQSRFPFPSSTSLPLGNRSLPRRPRRLLPLIRPNNAQHLANLLLLCPFILSAVSGSSSCLYICFDFANLLFWPSIFSAVSGSFLFGCLMVTPCMRYGNFRQPVPEFSRLTSSLCTVSRLTAVSSSILQHAVRKLQATSARIFPIDIVALYSFPPHSSLVWLLSYLASRAYLQSKILARSMSNVSEGYFSNDTAVSNFISHMKKSSRVEKHSSAASHLDVTVGINAQFQELDVVDKKATAELKHFATSIISAFEAFRAKVHISAIFITTHETYRPEVLQIAQSAEGASAEVTSNEGQASLHRSQQVGILGVKSGDDSGPGNPSSGVRIGEASHPGPPRSQPDPSSSQASQSSSQQRGRTPLRPDLHIALSPHHVTCRACNIHVGRSNWSTHVRRYHAADSPSDGPPGPSGIFVRPRRRSRSGGLPRSPLGFAVPFSSMSEVPPNQPRSPSSPVEASNNARAPSQLRGMTPPRRPPPPHVDPEPVTHDDQSLSRTTTRAGHTPRHVLVSHDVPELVTHDAPSLSHPSTRTDDARRPESVTHDDQEPVAHDNPSLLRTAAPEPPLHVLAAPHADLQPDGTARGNRGTERRSRVPPFGSVLRSASRLIPRLSTQRPRAESAPPGQGQRASAEAPASPRPLAHTRDFARHPRTGTTPSPETARREAREWAADEEAAMPPVDPADAASLAAQRAAARSALQQRRVDPPGVGADNVVDCVYCLESVAEPVSPEVFLWPCLHIEHRVHTSCILDTWAQHGPRRCPYCRAAWQATDTLRLAEAAQASGR